MSVTPSRYFGSCPLVPVEFQGTDHPLLVRITADLPGPGDLLIIGKRQIVICKHIVCQSSLASRNPQLSDRRRAANSGRFRFRLAQESLPSLPAH